MDRRRKWQEMISYHCDGCGREIPQNGLRYTVRIDIRAAYEEMEVGLMELVRDHRAEILRLIEGMDDKSAEDIEETIYKCLKIDLCPSCQRSFVRDPLRFQGDGDGAEEEIDIDGFLRSLGYGRGSAEHGEGPSD
ncbi:MAG: hypothetical protein QGD90_12930 [Candidatus Hydrogenedentes bacterium]|nr:hypothetical protein [Candidatus Hydrogenedentota bacterium]